MENELRFNGFAYKLGDDVNTDLIISGRYKFSISDMKELSRHIFEDQDPDFYKRLKPNETFLVTGNNFGMGSSREQAPLVIKCAGINAVLAKSFARIFYRNAFNVGLALIECDTDRINEADRLYLDLMTNTLRNITKNEKIDIAPIPEVMKGFLREGGVISYFKKYGGFGFGL
ncbi:MAG: 3-isopropylmalate dehydratase [Candidatus Omnitrophica bacterium]|nr:3-isopropylmalate dehydratase [Candidatus Omnitrophota bacterium]